MEDILADFYSNKNRIIKECDEIVENVVYFWANNTVDEVLGEEFNINSIDEDFVVSKTLSGESLSTYKENIWDFTPYISNPSQPTLIDFTKRIAKILKL